MPGLPGGKQAGKQHMKSWSALWSDHVFCHIKTEKMQKKNSLY
jgi:hypothetical protein